VTGIEVDENWEVVNVLVSTGIFKPKTVKLPMTTAAWDSEHLAFAEVRSTQAFNREVPPVAVAARVLTADVRVSIPEARPAGAITDQASRKVAELIFAKPGGMFRLATGQLIFQGNEIHIAAQTDTLTAYLKDRELLGAAREALASVQELTASERRAIELSAGADMLEVSGNVLTSRSRAAALQAVAHAVAPTAVKDAIVDDLSLEFAVSRSLLQSGIARNAIIHPRARLGEITLYGHTDSPTAAEEAVRVASRVPGVRSVINRLDIPRRQASSA
jgi:hypothetical protein